MFPLVDMSTRFCSQNQNFVIILAVLFDYPGSFHKRAHLCFVWFPCPSPDHTECTPGSEYWWSTGPDSRMEISTRALQLVQAPADPSLSEKGSKLNPRRENTEEIHRVWEMTMRVVISKKRINFMVRVTDSKLWEENYLLRKTKCLWWFGSRDIRLLLMSAKK